jgi:two-component system, cell cycle sensor histidine kinase and response regulator CckA
MGQTSLLSTSLARAALPPDGLLDAVPDAIMCVGEHRRVLWRNAAARRLFGEEASLQAAEPGEPLAQLLEHLKLPKPGAESGGGEDSRLVETRSGQGQLSAWEARWRGTTLEGERIWLLSVREAPQYRLIQNALYKAQERQLIGALAGGIAHDFNNLLAAVLTNLDLALTGGVVSPEAREFIARAQAGARRGAELNARLLAFSRRTDSQPTALDLSKAVEEVLFILARGLSKAIQTQFTPPGDLWPAKADKNRVVQALMNLCLNARDAMPRGGTLSIELANVSFDQGRSLPPRRAGRFVRMTVSDTGVGMPPEVLSRVFEPYFTTKTYGDGAGLSLPLAAHILAEQGGWIEAESRVGEGSRFHLFLPKAEPVDGVASARSLERRREVKSLDGTETILIVDDEAAVRLVLRAILQYRGYKVLEASSGEEALRQMEKGPGDVRLVLLDLDMPGLNGLATLARLRQVAPGLPVILSSGSRMDDPAGELARSGAAGFVEKPFRNQDLAHLVRATLDQEKDDQAASRRPP